MTAYYIPHSPTLNDSLSLIDPLAGDAQSDYLSRFSHAAHLGGPSSSAPRFDGFVDTTELGAAGGHYHHHHVHDTAHMYLPTSMLVGSMSPLDNPFQHAAAAAAAGASTSTSSANASNPTSLSQQQPFLEAAVANFDPALSYRQPWNAYEELDLHQHHHHHHQIQDAVAAGPPEQEADDEIYHDMVQAEAIIPPKASSRTTKKAASKSKKLSLSSTPSSSSSKGKSSKKTAASRPPIDPDQQHSTSTTTTTTIKKPKKLTKKQLKEQEQQQQLYLLHQQQQYNLSHQEPINSTETSPDSSSLNHLLGDAHSSIPPALSDTEPLFVNAKQYHRIIKRRNARARLQELHRLSTSRKVTSFPTFDFPGFISLGCLRARGHQIFKLTF